MKLLLLLILIQLVMVSALEELRPPIGLCDGIPIKSCPKPLLWNPITCTCGCGITLDNCVNLQNYNADTCRCECKIQETIKCPNFDPIACICPDQPNCDNVCFEDVYQDPITCECGCGDKICGEPRILNRRTCECDCIYGPESCVNLQTFNEEKCGCECKDVPPNCQKFDYERCICLEGCNNTCPKDVYQDPKTCECDCRNRCDEPWAIDPMTCKCNCTLGPKSCVNLQTFNEEKCGCECKNVPPNCQNFDYERCICLEGCNNTCPNGFYQDPKTCECDCRDVACLEPFVIDPLTCGCHCKLDPRTCVNLQTFNEARCRCECKNVPPNCQKFDYERCICLEGCNNTCPNGFHQDPKTCECDCSEVTCEKPRFINPRTCECGCRNGPDCCGNMQNFNEETCLCECQAIAWVKCEDFDPVTCSCPQK